MKRITKNIICLLTVIVLFVSIVLTIFIAKSNLESNNQLMIERNVGQGMPPDMPSDNEQNNSNNRMEESLEKPDGENNNSNDNMQTPPEKPDGNNNANSENMGEPPEKPDGDSSINSGMGMNLEMNNFSSTSLTVIYYVAICIETLLLSLVIIYFIQSKFNKKNIKDTYCSSDKILIYVLLTIISTTGLTFGISYLTNNYILKGGNIGSQNQMPGGMNNNSDITYSASTEINESKTISNENYNSETADENSLLVSGDIEVLADGIAVTKNGDSDGGDNTSFYGTNSAIIAKSGSILTIKNANITTDATGANGVFSYGGSATTQNATGDGTTINISNSTIITKKDNSGGIMTTGGGITNATDLTVETSGTSSAAIRSDRGGGTVNVDGGTYTTTGLGSPSIYSTANITVKNAKLISTMSEGVIIEGKNSIALEKVELIDTNNKLNGGSTTYKNIFLYQSMSGDADTGVSEFTSKDSIITTNNGDSFYITNTSSKIVLTNNTIINNDSMGNFLRAKADSWGNSGSNGGIVTLVMNNQKVSGNIVIDPISTLDMTMKLSSSYTGTINGDNIAKNIKITLDKTSTIKLTGDSYVSSLDNADSTNSNIDFNGYKLYVNGKVIN